MRKVAQIIFFVGILLAIYGYLCRAFEIYFFWDSKTFGWILLVIGLLCYLIAISKSKKNQMKKRVLIRIGIGVLSFVLIVSTCAPFYFHKSEPYKVAIEYLRTKSGLKDEIGTIKGFGLIPLGSIQTTTINGSKFGEAVFFLTIRAEKKYKDIEISLKKTPDTNWKVTSIY